METVAGALVVTTVCLVAGFATLRGAGAAAQVMSQMFARPAELGWPPGVQEDDDFHWRWSGGPPNPGETSEPELIDLTDGTGPRPLPVARHQARSAARRLSAACSAVRSRCGSARSS